MIISLLLGLQVAAAAPAPSTGQDNPAPAPPVTLMADMGDLHHPIATESEEAQKFFDQGLTLVYAFNHDEAIRSFRRAAELDPASPMPLWGVALALGPNIHEDINPEREMAAYDAEQQALKLAAAAPANERAYVNALAARYSNDPSADLKALATRYRNAMRDLTIAYPNDLDAAVLYAESIMDLHPAQLWTADGAPADGTIELVGILENVLKYDPHHIGANHYYIHAVEGSISPERAQESAERLKTLAPAAGHLLHMPSHIYVHTGDYAGAVAANEAAIEADRKFIEATKASGTYATMYYNPNLAFLASAAMMTGELEKASKAADELAANVLPLVDRTPEVEPLAAKKMFVLLRFAKWDDVLQVPQPDPKLKILTAVWHFGRGVAQAKKGNPAAADQEKAAYTAAKRTVAPDAMWGNNKASAVFAVADGVLDARIWLAKKDLEQSITAWKRAVAAQDKLAYNEPDDWFYPVRESLEAALLYAHRLDETERIFRQDQEHNPDNPRTLFIQYQFYTTTDDEDMALIYRRRFSDGWANSDVDLKLTDF
jgi:hypothetical protein